LRARARARADRFDRKPVSKQRMMPDLVQPAGWQFQSRREHAGRMAQFHERRALIELVRRSWICSFGRSQFGHQ
jgi:hypothetical protein